MKKIKLFLFLSCIGTPALLWADSFPLTVSDPSVCQQGSSDNCYLTDKTALNQPLDTETRGLGLSNRLIESDMNMFVNPGQVVNYGTAYLEGWLGNNLVWGGATVPMPAKQKLAVFLRRPLNSNSALGAARGLFNKYHGESAPTTAGAGLGLPALTGDGGSNYTNGEFNGGTFGILDTAKKGFGNVDMLYGLSLGNMNLGLRLSYASTSQSEEKTNATSTLKFNTSAKNVGAGLGLQWKDLGPGYLDVSVSTDIPIVRLEYDNRIAAGTETRSVKSGTPFSLGFLGRYVMPVGKDKLILATGIDTFNVPYTISSTTTAGVATNLEAASKALFISGDVAYHQIFLEGKLKIIYSTGVGSTKITYTAANTANASLLNSEYSITNFFIPLGVSAEHQTFESLKTRIGVRKNIASNREIADKTVTTNTTTNTSFYQDDELLVAMGLGWIPAEKVQIDFAMNANAFKLDTFFSALSARYHY